MSGFNGKDSEFASVVTLASSLDYTPSRSSLKWLLPLASDKNSSYRDQNLLFHAGYLSREDNIITMENVFCLQVETVQVLNVPVIPVGPLIATAYPLLRNPVYALSWLNAQISAQDMMDQKLFEKLVLNNFGRFQIFCFLLFSSQYIRS